MRKILGLGLIAVSVESYVVSTIRDDQVANNIRSMKHLHEDCNNTFGENDDRTKAVHKCITRSQLWQKHNAWKRLQGDLPPCINDDILSDPRYLTEEGIVGDM